MLLYMTSNASPEINQELAIIHRRAAILFFVLMLLTIIVTFIGWKYTLDNVQVEEKRKFETRSQEVSNWISNRVIAYHIILRGMTSYFENNQGMTLDEWANYVKENQITKYYPGVSSFGYGRYVPDDKLASYTSEMKKIYANFSINPPKSSYTDHYVVTYVEPYLGREKAIGFDQGTDKERRRVLEKSRDTGGIENTKSIDLVTTDKKGFFLTAPIYEPGTALGTTEQRRAAYRGYVFATFRSDEPFATIFSETAYPDMDIEIYDDGSITPNSLLFDSDPTRSALNPTTYGKTMKLSLENQEWTMVIAAKESFALSDLKKSLSWVPFFSSGLIVIILMALTWRQIYMHKKLLAEIV